MTKKKKAGWRWRGNADRIPEAVRRDLQELVIALHRAQVFCKACDRYVDRSTPTVLRCALHGTEEIAFARNPDVHELWLTIYGSTSEPSAEGTGKGKKKKSKRK
ncbi:MAG: hypothetical protein KDD53_07955 [Bdellovibrionales bacterium]|nr:hypothetical protein [Bdellovibrionales bacterium]